MYLCIDAVKKYASITTTVMIPRLSYYVSIIEFNLKYI